VLAHELGHFKHRHVIKRIALIFAMSLAFLAVLGQLIDADWFYAASASAARAEHGMALILFFFVVPVFTFLLTPLIQPALAPPRIRSRPLRGQHASAADLTKALVKLYEDNAATLTPDPLHSLFYDSHPPAALRIARLARRCPT
jgi:STE24 endopeptidase